VSGEFERAVQNRAREAGVSVSDAQIAYLRTYYELLARWTRRINLTSLPLEGYPNQSIDRLLIEPLLAGPFFSSDSPDWIDLGTGSGSPAVPLRIARPGGVLEMIESRQRKTAFLREVVRVLQLRRTEVRTTRIEDFAVSAPPSSADVITMRAVKPAVTILHAVARLLKPRGRFLWFGSTAVEELDGTAGIETAGLRVIETAPLIAAQHRLYVVTRR
jgi:16S rRNA (guanine527-N7)-methyltransferase